LAEALHRAKKNVTAFCGAQSADLVALTLDPARPPYPSAVEASFSAGEFTAHGAGVVISTDDGTLGFRGHVGAALAAHFDAKRPDPASLVVYTCGPERMMHFVARFCAQRGIECYACVERNMACGTGLCQSCVVPLHDDGDAEGWRYRLCCTDGPIFNASEIIWD